MKEPLYDSRSYVSAATARPDLGCERSCCQTILVKSRSSSFKSDTTSYGPFLKRPEAEESIDTLSKQPKVEDEVEDEDIAILSSRTNSSLSLYIRPEAASATVHDTQTDLGSNRPNTSSSGGIFSAHSFEIIEAEDGTR